MTLAASVTYGGISCMSASYTLGHGITPGVAEIECQPQNRPFPAVGDLVISDGENSVAFLGMRADQRSARRGSDGMTWRFTLLDRRWKWQFGAIFGEYNRRDDSDETIVQEDRPILGIEKTPRELAELLLDAMSEQRYDVSQLPNDQRPHVEWIGANPAQELASLADLSGCRVVLTLDGSVRLIPLGQGSSVPSSPRITEASLSSDPPERPDAIDVIGGPFRIQTRVDLEAVGLDTDGKIKPIDNLSYKPTNGWERENAQFGSITDAETLALAKKTVYRWYRLKVSTPISVPILPSDYQQITGIEQLVNVDDSLVEFAKDSVTAERTKKKARVYGVYYLNRADKDANSSTSADYEYLGDKDRLPGETVGGFTVDGHRNLVIFDQQVVKKDTSTNRYTAAELKLECSFGIRDQRTGQQVVWDYFYQVPGARSGTGPEVVETDTINLEVYESFSADGTSTGWKALREVSDLVNESRYLAEGAVQKYQSIDTADATHIGIVPISPDGALVQVTWSIEDGKPWTKISRGSETVFRQPKYGTRRFNELMKGVLKNRQAILGMRRVQALILKNRRRSGL